MTSLLDTTAPVAIAPVNALVPAPVAKARKGRMNAKARAELNEARRLAEIEAERLRALPTNLALLASAVADDLCARDKVIELVKVCGGNQKVVRDEVIAARMIHALYKGSDLPLAELRAKVDATLSRPGWTPTATDPERRTQAQEKAYGAARAYWTAILKAAGIASDSAKGGNSNAAKKTRAGHANAATVAETIAAPATPIAVNWQEVATYHMAIHAQMVAHAEKNAKGYPVAFRNFVAAHGKALDAIVAELTAKDAARADMKEAKIRIGDGKTPARKTA